MSLFLPDMMVYAISSAFLALLGFMLFLNVFSLPGNWVILAFVGLWRWLNPDAVNMGVFFFVLLIGLAVIGELLELGVQVMKARKYGSSSSGTFMGLVGAIIGAILLAPVFFGLGAFIGALLGAWIGCFIMEILRGRPGHEAVTAAFGTMVGRFLGTVCKCGVGGVMLAITARYIRDAAPEPVFPTPPPGPGEVVQLLQWLC